LEQKPKKLAVKLKEAAAMVSVSEISLRRKIKSGEIKAVKAFRHIIITVDELNRFLQRNT
jgi:excisionase family DNA binding protein